MAQSALAIYLDDHVAALSGEIQLVERVAGENQGTALGNFLHEYQEVLQRQKQVAESALKQAGGKPSSAKQAATWLAEKLGRLKLNDSLTSYTDLARVLELEALVCSAQLRLFLWETLIATQQPSDPHASDYVAAKDTSSHHLVTLREHHEYAKRAAFQGGSA